MDPTRLWLEHVCKVGAQHALLQWSHSALLIGAVWVLFGLRGALWLPFLNRYATIFPPFRQVYFHVTVLLQCLVEQRLEPVLGDLAYLGGQPPRRGTLTTRSFTAHL